MTLETKEINVSNKAVTRRLLQGLQWPSMAGECKQDVALCLWTPWHFLRQNTLPGRTARGRPCAKQRLLIGESNQRIQMRREPFR